jgi:hypothetical protein
MVYLDEIVSGYGCHTDVKSLRVKICLKMLKPLLWNVMLLRTNPIILGPILAHNLSICTILRKTVNMYLSYVFKYN